MTTGALLIVIWIMFGWVPPLMAGLLCFFAARLGKISKWWHRAFAVLALIQAALALRFVL